MVTSWAYGGYEGILNLDFYKHAPQHHVLWWNIFEVEFYNRLCSEGSFPKCVDIANSMVCRFEDKYSVLAVLSQYFQDCQSIIGHIISATLCYTTRLVNKKFGCRGARWCYEQRRNDWNSQVHVEGNIWTKKDAEPCWAILRYILRII